MYRCCGNWYVCCVGIGYDEGGCEVAGGAWLKLVWPCGLGIIIDIDVGWP